MALRHTGRSRRRRAVRGSPPGSTQMDLRGRGRHGAAADRRAAGRARWPDPAASHLAGRRCRSNAMSASSRTGPHRGRRAWATGCLHGAWVTLGLMRKASPARTVILRHRASRVARRQRGTGGSVPRSDDPALAGITGRPRRATSKPRPRRRRAAARGGRARRGRPPRAWQRQHRQPQQARAPPRQAARPRRQARRPARSSAGRSRPSSTRSLGGRGGRRVEQVERQAGRPAAAAAARLDARVSASSTSRAWPGVPRRQRRAYGAGCLTFHQRTPPTWRVRAGPDPPPVAAGPVAAGCAGTGRLGAGPVGHLVPATARRRSSARRPAGTGPPATSSSVIGQLAAPRPAGPAGCPSSTISEYAETWSAPLRRAGVERGGEVVVASPPACRRSGRG